MSAVALRKTIESAVTKGIAPRTFNFRISDGSVDRGRDTIDHAPGGHDDVVNAAAGALVLAAREGAREPFRFFGGGTSEEEFEVMRRVAHEEFMETIKRQGYYWPGQ